MKYIHQRDDPDLLYVTRVDMEGENREKGRATTVASFACGLCSAIIMADLLLVDPGFGLKEALKLSYDTGANRETGTDYCIISMRLPLRRR